MILAAGLGTRLKPLTLDIPKPFIPLVNRPIIGRLIQKLCAVGIKDIIINTHHLAERIEKEISGFLSNDMKITISHEPEIMGSAGGLKKGEFFFDDEALLLINGDIYFDFNFEEIIDTHKRMKASATLVLKENENLEKYGAVGIKECGEICMFPYGISTATPWKKGIFCGIHVIEPDVFDFIPPDVFFCINKNVYPSMIREGKKICGCFPSGKYWKDLGTVAEYLQAHWDILDGKIDISPAPGEVYYGRGCSVERNVKIIPPVWIGEETVIKSGGGIGPYVVLGKKNLLEKNVEINHSVIWNDVNIGAGSKILGAILSHNVEVGENVYIGEGKIIREHTVLTAE